jgi:UDP:flavonoid glycosyltransferase YjiC (YdhE family)
MRAALFALGTHGDVRPMVALGVALRRAGIDVVLAAEPRFAALVTEAGLEMAVISGDAQAVQALSATALVRARPQFPLNGSSLLLAEMARTWAAEGMAAAERADLIVSVAGATPLAAAIVEATGLPLVVVHPHPGGLIRQVPMSRIPGWNALLMTAHPYSWWQPFARGINRHVRPALGLRKSPWYGPDYGIRRRRVPKLLAFSPTLAPPRGAVPDFARVTGFWILDTGARWRPTSALTDFLAAGPPPVYVGFGSMPDPAPEVTRDLIVAAVRRTKHRAIVAAGWTGTAELGAELGGDRLFGLAEAPHEWLFPRMRAAVHHCGAGTTAAAVRAGIPSVPVPFLADQFLWAAALARAGAAPRMVWRPLLTARRLAGALDQADRPTTRAAAATLGERVRAEDGVAAATAALADWGLLR